MTAKHIFNMPWLPASETHGHSVAGGGIWAGDGGLRRAPSSAVETLIVGLCSHLFKSADGVWLNGQAPIDPVPVEVKDTVNETRVLKWREDDPDAFARTIANTARSTVHWTPCR